MWERVLDFLRPHKYNLGTSELLPQGNQLWLSHLLAICVSVSLSAKSGCELPCRVIVMIK